MKSILIIFIVFKLNRYTHTHTPANANANNPVGRRVIFAFTYNHRTLFVRVTYANDFSAHAQNNGRGFDSRQIITEINIPKR